MITVSFRPSPRLTLIILSEVPVAEGAAHALA